MDDAVPPGSVEARRFLHCCYCCTDAGTATTFFEVGLGLEERMRSTGVRVDGRQLGFPGEVETDARFVYDRRGPRTSPAIEVQAWIDPPTEGKPYAAPNNVGFHALGFAVADLDRTLAGLVELGSTVLGRMPGLEGVLEGRAVFVRDPTGVAIDVVESEALTTGTRMAHVRATCSDLDRSVEWYAALGFRVTASARAVSVPGAPFGLPADPTASFARLRLPDEPFAVVLTPGHDPRSRGRPYTTANHRGLYRAAVAVDDTRAAYQDLGHQGFGFTGPPQPVALHGTKVPEMWIAFTTDPDGLTFELVERPRSAFR